MPVAFVRVPMDDTLEPEFVRLWPLSGAVGSVDGRLYGPAFVAADAVLPALVRDALLLFTGATENVGMGGLGRAEAGLEEPPALDDRVLDVRSDLADEKRLAEPAFDDTEGGAALDATEAGRGIAVLEEVVALGAAAGFAGRLVAFFEPEAIPAPLFQTFLTMDLAEEKNPKRDVLAFAG